MKTALITGITGQDGSYVVDELRNRGCGQIFIINI